MESCVITGFTGTSIAQGNGIFFNAASGKLFVQDTIVRNVGNVGVWVQPTAGGVSASIDHCRFENDRLGSVTDFGASTTICDSTISGNSGEGLLAQYGGELNIENCQVANNPLGIESYTGSIVRVSNTTVTDNSYALIASGTATILSRGNNTVEGNGTDETFTGTYSAK